MHPHRQCVFSFFYLFFCRFFLKKHAGKNLYSVAFLRSPIFRLKFALSKRNEMNTILGTTHQVNHDLELSISPLSFILFAIILGIYTALNKLL